MKTRLFIAIPTIAIAAMPAAAIACDLDGLPGMHRFNPFAQVPGFKGLAPPQPEPQAKSRSTQDDSKKKDRKRPERETPIREWERDTGNGPISAEDKATFT